MGRPEQKELSTNQAATTSGDTIKSKLTFPERFVGGGLAVTLFGNATREQAQFLLDAVNSGSETEAVLYALGTATAGMITGGVAVVIIKSGEIKERIKKSK